MGPNVGKIVGSNVGVCDGSAVDGRLVGSYIIISSENSREKEKSSE